MQYIKQIMLLVILTISWKCQAEEVKEIWLDELGESSYYIQDWLASLDEPRKPKPGLSRIRRNLYRRGSLNRR